MAGTPIRASARMLANVKLWRRQPAFLQLPLPLTTVALVVDTKVIFDRA